MEKLRKKMRLEIKTTYFNNKVVNPLIVMSLFEDSDFYDNQSVYSEIVESKLIYVGKTIPTNLKKDYTIKKIYSANTFIEFAGTAIREPKTILKSVYQVLMSVESREGELQNDSL
jgi:hypothetical protein